MSEVADQKSESGSKESSVANYRNTTARIRERQLSTRDINAKETNPIELSDSNSSNPVPLEIDRSNESETITNQMSANDVRKRIQMLRLRARSNNDLSKESMKFDRMPSFRGLRNIDEEGDETTNLLDDDKEANQNNDDTKEDDDESYDYYKPIIEINIPIRQRVLTLRPHHRKYENKMSSIQYVPYPTVSLHIPSHLFKECCYCCCSGGGQYATCCGGAPYLSPTNPSRHHKKRNPKAFDERNLLMTNGTTRHFRSWIERNSRNIKELFPFTFHFIKKSQEQALMNGNPIDLRYGLDFVSSDLVTRPIQQNSAKEEEEGEGEGKGNQEGEEEGEGENDRVHYDLHNSSPTTYDCLSRGLSYFISPEDGLYTGGYPVLAKLLLKGEPVDTPQLKELVIQDVHLSRVTHRLLRELYQSEQYLIKRNQWFDALERQQLVLDRSDEEGEEDEGTTPVEDRGKDSRNIVKPPSELYLLKQSDSFPFLSIPEDPHDNHYSQSILPYPTVSYGGRLGYWGMDATLTDRLGYFPTDYVISYNRVNRHGLSPSITNPLHIGGHSQRTIPPSRSEQLQSEAPHRRLLLRLHLHRLRFTTHPLMNPEERLRIQLLQHYQTYHLLLKSRAMEYFIRRVNATISYLKTKLPKLTQKMEEKEESGWHGQDMEDVTNGYEDLLRGLPSLLTLHQVTEERSGQLVSKWNELIRLRLDQGYRCCAIELQSKRITRDEYSHILRDTHPTFLGPNHQPVETTTTSTAPPSDPVEGGGETAHDSSSWMDEFMRHVASVPSMVEMIHKIFAYIEEVPIHQLQRSMTDTLRPQRTGGPLPSLLQPPGTVAVRNRSNSGGSVTSVGSNRSSGSLRKRQPPQKTGTSGGWDGNDGTSLEQLRREKMIHDAQRSNASHTLMETTERLLSGQTPLLPHVVYQLKESPQTVLSSFQDLPVEEIHRREFMDQLQYRLVVKVNGCILTSTAYRSIHCGTMILDFSENIELSLAYQPLDVSIDLVVRTMTSACCPTPHSVDTVLVTIPLPLPGQQQIREMDQIGNILIGGQLTRQVLQPFLNLLEQSELLQLSQTQRPPPYVTHSVTPCQGWYSFTTPSTHTRSGWEGLLPPWMKSLTECGNEEYKKFRVFYNRLATLSTEGGIYCITEYSSAYADANGSDLEISSRDWALFSPSDQQVEKGNPFVTLGGRNGYHQNMDPHDETVQQQFSILIDWNDPRNDKLYQKMFQTTRKLKNKSIFRLSGQDISEPFHTQQNFGANYENFFQFKDGLRFKLLRLRQIKPFLFTAPIPLMDAFIKNHEVYKKILENERESLGIMNFSDYITTDLRETAEDETAETDYNPIVGVKESVHVGKVVEFLERVRSAHAMVSRGLRKKQLLSTSVVRENDYLTPAEDDEILNIFERKRSLRPRPKKRVLMTANVDTCTLLIQVIGAKNIPLRNDLVHPEETINYGNERDFVSNNRNVVLSEPLTPNGRRRPIPSPVRSRFKPNGETTTHFDFQTTNSQRPLSRGVGVEDGHYSPRVNEHMLDERKMKEKRRARTFVEISFQDHKVATVCSEGGTPMWKQSVALPFKMPENDFSPEKMETSRDLVYFTIFDEFEEDDTDRGGFLDGENPIRKDKRYLGSLSIPISTIWKEGRIEGIFRVESPAINFGYIYNSSLLKTTTTGLNARNGMFEGGTVSWKAEAAAVGKTREEDEEEDALEVDRLIGRSEKKEGGEVLVLPSCPTDLVSCLSWTSFWSKYLQRQMDYVLQQSKQLMMPTRSSSPLDENNIQFHRSFIHSDTMLELSYFASGNENTAIKLLITLDPILLRLPEVLDTISLAHVHADDKLFAYHGVRWLKGLRSLGLHSATRNYKVFVVNSAGSFVHVCRYLTPQKPPPGFRTRRACMHLVSMIPFMKDAQAFIGESDLWCTSAQFWEIGAGDEEEHAVLLYNYLYYLTYKTQLQRTKTLGTTNPLGSQSRSTPYPTNEFIGNEILFLAIGRAIPEGNTVYVIVRDVRRRQKNPDLKHNAVNYLVINPWTGFVYCALDASCPLREILCLVTPYNLWANIQENTRPGLISYDVLNPLCWRPFFGVQMPFPTSGLHSIQNDIEYLPTETPYILQIERTLRDEIKRNFRRWRSKRYKSGTTTFHPESSSIMEEILESMESWKRLGPNPSDMYGQSVLFTGNETQPRSITRQFSNPSDGPLMLDNLSSNDSSSGSDAPTDSGPDKIDLTEIERQVQFKMKKLLKTHILRGSTLNIPFTDLDEILSKLSTLCVHESQHPDVRFVLGIRAFPLFNNVVSLWIFLGTLESALITGMESALLTKVGIFKCKVSSVLNGLAEFAGKNMFDGNADTCWNSDQGSPQYILIDFGCLVLVKQVYVTFQGGFAGSEGLITVGNDLQQLKVIHILGNIQDNNEQQFFVIEDYGEPSRYLKITFNGSTDFYGRITIYNLQIFGNQVL